MSFTMLSETRPKARKAHRCCWCWQDIVKDETYYRFTGVCDGDFQCTKLHAECEAAMDRDMIACRAGGDPEYYLPDPSPRGMTPGEYEDARDV